MSGCYYVNKTLDGLDMYSKSEFIFTNDRKNFLDDLWTSGSPLETKELIDLRNGNYFYGGRWY